MTAATEPIAYPVRRTSTFDPPPELAALRSEHPVTRLRYPDGALGWLVTSYDLVRAVLSDQRFSSSRLPGVFPIAPQADAAGSIGVLTDTTGVMEFSDPPVHS